jgi:hypothetical protein
VELSEKNERLRPWVHGTLAAALAETGDFDKAVQMGLKAYDLYKPTSPTDQTKEDFKAATEAYKNKQTWIQWESKNRERK